jgi:hypothetical protein
MVAQNFLDLLNAHLARYPLIASNDLIDEAPHA